MDTSMLLEMIGIYKSLATEITTIWQVPGVPALVFLETARAFAAEPTKFTQKL